MKKPAAGTKGYLLLFPDPETGIENIIFRVYNEDKTYKDYQIRHQDLRIELLSGHLYEEESFVGY